MKEIMDKIRPYSNFKQAVLWGLNSNIKRHEQRLVHVFFCVGVILRRAFKVAVVNKMFLLGIWIEVTGI